MTLDDLPVALAAYKAIRPTVRGVGVEDYVLKIDPVDPKLPHRNLYALIALFKLVTPRGETPKERMEYMIHKLHRWDAESKVLSLDELLAVFAGKLEPIWLFDDETA